MASEMMTPTAEQCEQLARVFSLGQTGYEDDWADLYIDADSAVVTQDTLAGFLAAARNSWVECKEMQEINGGLFFSDVQALRGQQRCDLAVIDCGDFRLLYQQ